MQTRRGYCEMFAGTYAAMARSIGLPSRVAVGFTPGDADPDDPTLYTVRGEHAHAWPEVYFGGVGWVRFEPTPSVRAPGVPGYTTGSFDTPEPTALPSVSASAPERDDATRKLRQTDLAAPTGGGSDGGGRGLWPIGLGVVLVLALLVAPRLLRTTVRKRRWSVAKTPADVAEAGWRELRDTALDLRLPWEDDVTLRTRARSLATCFGRTGATPSGDLQLRRGLRGAHTNPEADAALQRLVHDVEEARYSRERGRDGGRDRHDVSADVETCAEALEAGVTSRRRRHARWLPASLWRNGAWRSIRDARSSGGITLSEPSVDRAG